MIDLTRDEHERGKLAVLALIDSAQPLPRAVDPDACPGDLNHWLTVALNSAGFAEDVEALGHFVLHPNWNGCSNVCVLCDSALDDTEDGHDDQCPYLLAVKRTATTETLAEYVERH